MLDFSSDISYKSGKFFKILLKKSLKFISIRKNGIIIFNLSLILLSTEVDPILKEQSLKKDALEAYRTGHIEIVLAL